jgi:hypothetical protein
MQATRLIAAALLSVAAAGAMAQELDWATPSFVSTRSSEAVKAEARNTRVAGQWLPGGEAREAAVAPAVEAPAVALTRQEVKRQVAVARAAHRLTLGGESM